MRRWIALGVAGLGVAWGPYVYSELSSKAVDKHVTTDSMPLTAASAVEPQFAPAQVVARPAPAFRSPPTAAALAAPVPASPALVVADNPEPPANAVALPTDPDDTTPSQELAPRFRQTFDSEPRDAFWASDEEPRIARVFKDADVPDAAIAEVACRKSVCRVTFTKLELETEVEAKLYTRLHEDLGRSLALGPHSPDDEAHAPLYMLRAGYKLDAAR